MWWISVCSVAGLGVLVTVESRVAGSEGEVPWPGAPADCLGPTGEQGVWWAVLRSQKKLVAKPYLHTCSASPTVSIGHQSGTFVTADEPCIDTWLLPKSMADTGVYSWCCPFGGFEKSVHHYTTVVRCFHCPKILPSALVTADLCTVFVILLFPERHTVGLMQYCCLFRFLYCGKIHIA